MKRIVSLLGWISIALFPFGPAASAVSPADSANAAGAGKTASNLEPNPGFPLKKGMSAQEVKAHWGAPLSVEPFAAPTAKAEVWTYHYTLSDQTTQVVTSTTMQPEFRGEALGVADTPELVYGLKRTEVTQVVKLLMYDGMLVSWKKSIERNESLE